VRSGRETVEDRILTYLRGRSDGRAHTGVIAEALNVSLPTVSTTLRRAEQKGHRPVHQVRKGVWALGLAPVARADAVRDEAA
jgi:Mn-dependent DtxR family transcriptional regulator